MGNGNKTGTIQRRINQLQAGGLSQTGTNLSCLDCLVECLLTVIAHEADHSLLNALRKGHGLRAGQDIGLLNLIIDNGSGVIRHLTTVRTISLITIVLGRIVGCSHHDTCVAVIISGGKGQCRHGHQRIIDANLDSICGKNACCLLRKDITLQTAVIGDGNGLISSLSEHPVGKTLSRLANHPDVHTVGTGTQCSAKSCGTELQ